MAKFWDSRDNRPNSYVSGTIAKSADVNGNETFLEKYRSFNNLLVVDTDGIEDTNCDKTTVQGAIDQAVSDGIGYHIFIRVGTYDEDLDTFEAGVTLEGENKSQSIILGNGAAEAITVDANYITVDNLTISKTTSAENAIQVNGKSNFHLKNCIVTSDQTNSTIYVLQANDTDLSNLIIENCYIRNTALNSNPIISFQITSGSDDVNSTFKNISILNNKLVVDSLGNNKELLRLEADTGTTTTKSEIFQVRILGNRIYSENAGTGYGIRISVANNANCKIEEVTINNNLINGSGGTDYGIYLYNAGASGTLDNIAIGSGNSIYVDSQKEIRLSTTYPTNFSTGGYWVDFTSIANWTGGGTMTFGTITTETARFSIIGRTCYINAFVQGTTGGTASDNITFTVPVAFKESTQYYNTGGCMADDGPFYGGLYFNSNATLVAVKRYDNANFGLGAGRGFGVNFHYEI